MTLKYFTRVILGIAVLMLGFLLPLSGQTREIRVATFNTSLFRNSSGALLTELSNPNAINPRRIAEIIQRVDPDVILLNEFDYDAAGESLERLHLNFLTVSQNGQDPIDFQYRYTAESNTGIASGFDLNNSGRAITTPMTSGYGEDAFGFGQFEGQYGMAALSKYPIVTENIRTFQKFLWKDMPDAKLPDFAVTAPPNDWYNAAELEVVRLSSKSHWDLPIDVDGEIVHLLGSHPTPPIFDGVEDRNGLRNHDEIRLWADYVLPGAGDYLYDDLGGTGGIGNEVRFVICGDQNADPVDGDSVDFAILQLLNNPAVNSIFVPQGSSGTTDTSSFGLRADYVLPSKAGLEVVGGAMFWPTSGQDGADLVGASDHRLVWMDLALTPLISEAVRELSVGIDAMDVVLSWGSEAGNAYEVECSADLETWELVDGGMLEIVAGAATFRDVGGAGSAGRKYYRVKAAFE